MELRRQQEGLEVSSRPSFVKFYKSEAEILVWGGMLEILALARLTGQSRGFMGKVV